MATRRVAKWQYLILASILGDFDQGRIVFTYRELEMVSSSVLTCLPLVHILLAAIISCFVFSDAKATATAS